MDLDTKAESHGEQVRTETESRILNLILNLEAQIPNIESWIPNPEQQHQSRG